MIGTIMLEDRQRRIGENEAIFRDVNQMIRFWIVRKRPGLPAAIARQTDDGHEG